MKRHTKKNDIAALLKNKNVLYVVLFFAVMNLFSYLMLKQLDAVAFFIIIGFLTTYFSKNMIIVMLTAMISTFLLVQINLLGNKQEGFDASEKKVVGEDEAGASKAGESKAGESKAGESKAVAGEAGAAGASDSSAAGASDSSAASAPPDPTTGNIPINSQQRAKLTAATSETQKAPEKFTQQLNPARYNGSDDDDVPRHKPKVDYASTLESAYDNLDKLLSSDAIKSMTEDTGRLADKQKQLMGNIERIQPVMDKAKGILDTFDMSAITKLMSNIGKSTTMLKGIQDPAAGQVADPEKL
jgi:hypothetical protein